MRLTADQGHELAELLEALATDRGPLADLDDPLRKRILSAVGRIAHPDRADRRALNRSRRKEAHDAVRAADKALLDRTRIRVDRAAPLFLTPRRAGEARPDDRGARDPLGRLSEDRVCYVCRQPYRDVHWFYDQLCPACGDFNHARRSRTVDLRGRVALVTGGRVKIGYQTAILLLRAGAAVHVTTRFPNDARRRFLAEPDAPDWHGRLTVWGIDLRHTPSVEHLCQGLVASLPQLDVLINNACQTVRRPAGFYRHLLDGEDPAAVTLPEDLEGHLFPAGRLDQDQQQLDLRRVNSWRLKLADVPTSELLEVHLVNAVAPFVLNARLKPLFLRTPTRDKHVVNVSAMEGQFYRTMKSDRHPHTNMAKAALNMLTRTSAADYVADGIHMNSVDTGWVTDEDPFDKAAEKAQMHDFSPPLDIVDGAARILDPVFGGFETGEHPWGRFFKDYRVTDW